MMNKKAIELSINFIVIMIIAIAVFLMGIKLTYDLMIKAEEMKEDVDQQTQKEIEEVLTSGEIVAIPINHKSTKIANSVGFGLGVFNIEDTQNFEIYMSFEKAFGNDREEITLDDGDSWILTYFGPYEILKNNQKILNLPVRVPRKIESGVTPPGTYIFKIEVKNQNGDRYGNVQKVYVEVK